MITQETFVTNLLARTAVVATQDYDNETFEVILPTRNEYIINFFNGGSIEFQDYHESTKTYQVYDILTNQVRKLNIEKLSLALYGLPLEIAPPVIANPQYHDFLSNKDLFDLHLPFLEQIKKIRDAGKLKTLINEKEHNKNSIFLNFLTCTFGECNYDLFMDNAISVYCNTDLHDYIDKNFELMRGYETLELIYKEKQESLNIKNIAALSALLNEKTVLKQQWKEFLLKKRDLLVEEHLKEKEQVLNDLKSAADTQEVELLFVEQQYNTILESLQNLDLDKDFDKLTGNTFLFYIPDVIWHGIQDSILTTLWLNTSTLKLLSALKENNIEVSENITREYLIYATINNTDYTSFEDFLSQTYVGQLKEIRLTQVKEHAEKLAESIKSEAVDLDESDLNEIISLVLDFDQFEREINDLTSINEVLQYWPAVLLPSPSFVKYI